MTAFVESVWVDCSLGSAQWKRAAFPYTSRARPIDCNVHEPRLDRGTTLKLAQASHDRHPGVLDYLFSNRIAWHERAGCEKESMVVAPN